MDTIQEIIANINDRRILGNGSITLEEINAVLLNYPQNSFLLYTAFTTLLESEGTKSEEIELFFKKLITYPLDTYNALSLGTYYESVTKDYERAISMYKLSIERDKENINFWAHIHLSDLYDFLYDIINAQLIITNAYRIFPDNILIKLKVADYWLKSIETLEEAFSILEAIPDKYRGELWYGLMTKHYVSIEDYTSAHYYADKSIAIAPESIYTILAKISIFMYENRNEEAIEMCDLAITKFPDAEILLYNKALAEMGVKNFGESERLLNEAIRICTAPKENITFMYFQMIYLYIEMGDYEKAQKYLEQNLSELRDRCDVWSHSVLISYYISQEAFQKALEEFYSSFTEEDTRGYLDDLLLRYDVEMEE